MKLFPNFTRHHLITYTNLIELYPGFQRVFFLLFAVKIERRSHDRDEGEKNPSGHGNYEPRFHAILKQDSSPNRFFVGSFCFRNLTCLHVEQ